MVHFTEEGETSRNGLNIQKISDGGFALIFKYNSKLVYFRRRGSTWRERGLDRRYILDWDF